MPSTYTASLRFEMQAAGENLNTWGAPKLNNALSRLDFAIAGWTTKALTGNYSLTSSNTSDDEARSAALKFTGTGAFTVTIPSVSKNYVVWNACAGDVTITTGAGASVALGSSEKNLVFCDGMNVYSLGFNAMSNRAYVDRVAFTANAGNLPAQAGNAGKFVKTDGTAASWAQPATADVSDYASDQAAKLATATGLAVAFATTL